MRCAENTEFPKEIFIRLTVMFSNKREKCELNAREDFGQTYIENRKVNLSH